MARILIILAAGESSRLGTSKLELQVGNRTLLERTMEIGGESDFDEVVVVLGAQAANLGAKLSRANVHFTINEGWQEGMGSSIRHGVNFAMEKFPTSLIGVSVVDQPFLTSEVLNELIQKSEKTGKITASRYGNGQTGVPAVFQGEWIKRLKELTGDKGARDLLNNPAIPIEHVEFPGGDFDIDTPEDLDRI